MKKVVSLLLSLVLLLGVLSACGKKDNKEDGEASGEVLKVGIMAAAMAVPVAYANDQGYFKDEGLDVQLVMFASGVPVNEAMAAKEIDVAATGLASVHALAAGIGTWIADDCGAGGMGIYVPADSPILKVKGSNPNYPDVYGDAETVSGISVAGPVGTNSSYNTVKWLAALGMEDTAVSMVNMEHSNAYQAMITGQVDAVATLPPFAYQLQDQGYVLAASFEDVSGFVLHDGILARSDVVEPRHDDIVKFLRAVWRAVDAFNQSPDLRVQYSVKWFNENGRTYTEEDVKREMVDRPYFSAADLSASDYVFGSGFEQIGEYYASVGQIDSSKVPNIKAHLNPSLLEEALNININ